MLLTTFIVIAIFSFFLKPAQWVLFAVLVVAAYLYPVQALAVLVLYAAAMFFFNRR